MTPAHDKVAAFRWMSVYAEVATLELKLDPNALSLADINLAFSFTVRISSLNCFNCISELPS
jgi:hypothetical protein